MAIMESVNFNYDGKYSSDFGIYNVTLDNGLFQESFLSKRNIVETKVRGNPKPYFHSIEYEPLTFKLTFAFQDTWNDDLIRNVARWLGGQTFYKPLWFAEHPDRIFYCILSDDSNLVHNGLQQGYVTLTMRCDSPYSYSPLFTDSEIDLSTNTASGTVIQFTNRGDIICKPEISIKVVTAGDIRIVNNTTSKEFKFTGLQTNENIYVDNEREYISTDIPLTYRYTNFNNNYLEMTTGVNQLTVYGQCKIQLRYQFKLLQG